MDYRVTYTVTTTYHTTLSAESLDEAKTAFTQPEAMAKAKPVSTSETLDVRES